MHNTRNNHESLPGAGKYILWVVFIIVLKIPKYLTQMNNADQVLGGIFYTRVQMRAVYPTE